MKKHLILPVLAGSLLLAGCGQKDQAATGAPVATTATTARATGTRTTTGSVRAIVATIIRTPSRAPVEAWSWYLRRSGAWLPAVAKLDGVHPTTTDVT